MLPLLHLACLFLPHTGAPPAPSILSAVPDDATALVYCQNFASFRERALRNDWGKLLRSQHGELLLMDLEQEFKSQTRTQLGDLYGMAEMLQGESVLFTGENSAGFLTTPPVAREELAAAMRAWLPGADKPGARTTRQVGTAQLELIAWPAEGRAGRTGRSGHYAAYVDHPQALGLFSADSLEQLTGEIEAALAGLSTDHRAPLVTGLESARGSATPGGGLEFYIDFSPLIDEAQDMIAEAAEEDFPDPSGLLGLEKDTWLYVTTNFFPGRRVDIDGFLNIPRGTLAADLADTFRPLPLDMPGRLPGGIWTLYAMNWDIGSFYTRARQAYVEKFGEESIEFFDAGVQAAEAMSGVDPMKAFFEQLDGLFAVYFASSEENKEVKDPEYDDMHDFGVLVGLRDGELFLDALEQLIGVAGLETVLDLDETEGFDVFRFSKQDAEGKRLAEEFDGGLAFLPHTLVLAAEGTVLTRHLQALKNIEGTSSLDEGIVLGAFNDNPGASFLSCVTIEALQRQYFRSWRANGTAPEKSAGTPFESILTASAVRTADGFRLRARAR